MTRHLSLMSTLVLFLIGATPAIGQQWAEQMFEVRAHDFGTVARGSKSEHVFEFKNLYKEDIHVAGVRASCGCVTPIVQTQTVKTWETGRILARFNTATFTGNRNATLTVVLDRPLRAEIQLHIKGTIRTDIVFEPGIIDFGTVDQGFAATRVVNVSKYYDPDWMIDDVLCMNPNYSVWMKVIERNRQRVTYQLQIEISKEHDAGPLHDELIIVNKKSKQDFRLAVEGEVLASISVSPQNIDFGDVEIGTSVTKKIFVRAADTLNISSVKCNSDCLAFQTRKLKDNICVVSVTMNPETAGELSADQSIQIEADNGRKQILAIPISGRIK